MSKGAGHVFMVLAPFSYMRKSYELKQYVLFLSLWPIIVRMRIISLYNNMLLALYVDYLHPFML